jgi:hypothetical protein
MVWRQHYTIFLEYFSVCITTCLLLPVLLSHTALHTHGRSSRIRTPIPSKKDVFWLVLGLEVPRHDQRIRYLRHPRPYLPSGVRHLPRGITGSSVHHGALGPHHRPGGIVVRLDSIVHVLRYAARARILRALVGGRREDGPTGIRPCTPHPPDLQPSVGGSSGI